MFVSRIPDELVEKIIQENDIVDVISEYVPLKNSGKNYMGVCPFHLDKGPSFSVSREKGLYHCFGCNASGNTIGFIMNIKNMEFLDALKYLGDRVGISIEKENKLNDNSNFKLKSEIYKVNVEAARYFFTNLFKNKMAKDYFVSRGIEEKVIKRFGLGYSLDGWHNIENYLIKKGFSKDVITKAGLTIEGKNGSYDRFRNRVMFPVFDYKGKVIGFGGRVLDDNKPKYLNSPETTVFHKGTNLYGLNFAVKDRIPNSIIVVEGYMDLISISQSGITNVVATLGTALTEGQAKLIKRYTKEVYLCYDSDSAGQMATLKGMEVLNNVGCNVKIIRIPKGKDPDEFIKNNGIENFRKIMEEALSEIDYKLTIAEEGFDLKNTNDNLKFAKKATYIISSLNSEIEIQHYGKIISEKLGISETSIIEDVKKIKNKGRNRENTQTNFNNLKIEPGFKKSEQMLLAICLKSKDYFKYIKGKVSIEEFITPCYKSLLEILYKNNEISESSILLNFNIKSDINDIAILFNKEIPSDINEDMINSYIKVIKRYNIEEQIKSINSQIKICEKSGDNNKALEFFNQLITLQKQLDTL